MFARPWLEVVQRFVEVASEVANSLDFATVVREPRYPLGRQERLRALWLDLHAAGRASGSRAGHAVKDCQAVIDELDAAAVAHDEGDLDPWLERRERVRSLLDELRSAATMANPPTREAGVVVRSASVSSASSRREHLPTIIDVPADAGREGEKGGKVASEPAARTANGRRILSLLLEHGAIQEEDRVTREYIADESRLTIEKVRRAIEHDLKPGGLIESKLGRDGGLWLAQAGIAAAQSLAAK